jgi:hypothetical protein
MVADSFVNIFNKIKNGDNKNIWATISWLTNSIIA